MLLRRSDLAKQWAEVTDCAVRLIIPEAYQEFVDAHRRAFCTRAWEQEVNDEALHRKEQKRHGRKQQLKVWSPVGNQAMLAGVIASDPSTGRETVHTDPDGMLAVFLCSLGTRLQQKAHRLACTARASELPPDHGPVDPDAIESFLKKCS